MGNELAKIESFRADLAKAETFEEISFIKSQSEAVAEFIKRMKLGKKKQDEIGEFIVEIDAKQGEWLEKHFPSKVNANKRASSIDADAIISMQDIGINVHQSSNSRLIAKEKELVQEAIEEIKKDAKQVVTPNAVQKKVRQKLKEEKIKARIEEIEQIEEKIKNDEVKKTELLYDVICIDPPWDYREKGGIGSKDYNPDTLRGATPYPTMTINEIENIELPASENCVLFLWTTHSFLRNSFVLLDKWNFTYKATLVWDKEIMGLGRNIRMQCEFCLMAFKGNPTVNGSAERDIIREKRREHSRKPDSFYDMVNRMTVGLKLDYFSREKRENWHTYGAEIEKF